ncbi:hypothetical protein [Nocardia sp. NPDC050793]|uniref:hypothetical protein n=1 Tax=Nocardia sp. NPDC050793 TaxID=3155159 RepID=UPI003405A33A
MDRGPGLSARDLTGTGENRSALLEWLTDVVAYCDRQPPGMSVALACDAAVSDLSAQTCGNRTRTVTPPLFPDDQQFSVLQEVAGTSPPSDTSANPTGGLTIASWWVSERHRGTDLNGMNRTPVANAADRHQQLGRKAIRANDQYAMPTPNNSRAGAFRSSSLLAGCFRDNVGEAQHGIAA